MDPPALQDRRNHVGALGEPVVKGQEHAIVAGRLRQTPPIDEAGIVDEAVVAGEIVKIGLEGGRVEHGVVLQVAGARAGDQMIAHADAAFRRKPAPERRGRRLQAVAGQRLDRGSNAV